MMPTENIRRLIVLRRFEDAQQAIQDARRATPKDASLDALDVELDIASGEIERAWRRLGNMIQADPANPMAIVLQAYVLLLLGRITDADAKLQQLGRRPLSPQIDLRRMETLAQLRMAQGRPNDAATVLEKALRIAPSSAFLRTLYGCALEKCGDVEKSRRELRQALALDPADPLTLWNLASAEMKCGYVDDALDLARRAYAIEPENEQLVTTMLLAATASSRVDAPALLELHRQCIPQSASELAAKRLRSSERIHIGYFSHHLRRFPLACFLPHVMQAHDRSAFRVTAFSVRGTFDEVTDRYRAAADEFIDAAEMDDSQLVSQIRRQKVDVLIDVSGLTMYHRARVLAARPARLQLSWLGYLQSYGSNMIDAHITDDFAVPRRLAMDALFDEKLVRLSSQYAYQSEHADLPIEPLAASENGYVTFGVFSTAAKVNADFLRAVGQIMQAVGHARLQFFSQSRDLNEHVLRIICGQGAVSSDRVSFFGVQPHAQYMRMLGRTDIVLDTFPMVGGTTVCDAVWMGTPVVSMFLPRGFGGASSSVLNHVSCSELVTFSAEEYVACAVRLAGSFERLIEYRQTLRARMLTSPLCDTKRVTTELEAAIVMMLR
jgi:predicted O-linked N-acetylglucosamine transferase (SPINDLY family)